MKQKIMGPSQEIKRATSAGVTLIELMVAVVIIGILSAIAIPSYKKNVMRSNRSEAKSTLLTLMQSQEQYYVENTTYTKDFTDIGYNISSPLSEQKRYSISADTCPDPDNAGGGNLTIDECVLLVATAQAGKSQVEDFDLDNNVISLSLSSFGIRSPEGAWSGKY